jgi:membrane protein
MAPRVPRWLREWVREIGADKVPRLAAALAYFGLFALPALLAVVLAVVGSVYGFERTSQTLLAQFEGLSGSKGADLVRDMLHHVDPSQKTSVVAASLGVLALLSGATGFMLQLQDALNTMWDAKPRAKGGGFVRLVLRRLFSLAMLFTLGMLLLASLALTAALEIGAASLRSLLGVEGAGVLVGVLDGVVMTGLLTLLFALVFRFMPDVRVRWREVWFGAGVTALLVIAGKWALGFYFGRSDPGATFGAAGPLAVIVAWMYYFTLIVLIGAEFTQVYARLHGPWRAERAKRHEEKSAADGDGRRRVRRHAAPPSA